MSKTQFNSQPEKALRFETDSGFSIIIENVKPWMTAKNKVTPLMWVCQHTDNHEFIKAMIDAGHYVDKKDRWGRTAQKYLEKNTVIENKELLEPLLAVA